MRLISIALGLASWTLGVTVPAVYTVQMAHAAVRDGHHTYDIHELMGSFNAMPLVLWLYLIAMAIAGLLLFLHGLARRRLEDELSI